MSTQPAFTPWLTKAEAAAYTRLTVGEIEAAMRRRELRFSGGGRIGARRVVIHMDWLDAWLAERESGRRVDE